MDGFPPPFGASSLWGITTVLLSVVLFSYAWLSGRRLADLERQRNELSSELDKLRAELRGLHVWCAK